MLDILPDIFIVLAAFAGIILTVYIHQKKRHHAPMVCPLGSDCGAVIHSEFSTFFGVPVELWGMFYYAAIFASYVAILAVPQSVDWGLLYLAVSLSLGAFLFSGYLTFIQGFTLKQWCTWCLTSAGLCSVIFGLSLFGVAEFMPAFGVLLAANKGFIVGVHLFGLAIGLGGATMADMFFFKFLRDLRISEREAEVLRSISQFIWLGLAILVVSGIGLVLPDSAFYFSSPKFQVKMLVVLVVIVNGAFLNLYITPKLIHISFGDPHKHYQGELRRDRRLAYALGAVSAISWYSAFILGLMHTSPMSFQAMLAIYVAVLAVAITTSQIMERIIARRGWNTVELRSE